MSEMTKKISEQKQNEFIERYGQFYIKGSNEDAAQKEKILGEKVKLNPTNQDVEDFIVNELRLQKEALNQRNGDAVKIKKSYIAWKAGKLLSPEGVSDSIQNGWGKKIENLDSYIESINRPENIGEIRKHINKNEIEEAYKKLSELNTACGVKNLGSVYIITLIYFLSGGKYPIYDCFAHTAVRALYMNENPKDIFIGGAPNKTDTNKVMVMYKEYCWLLKQVFGKYDICRELDQALWVYGHSTIKYELDNKNMDDAKNSIDKIFES